MHVGRSMSFLAQQMLDGLSPASFVATNPELFIVQQIARQFVGGPSVSIDRAFAQID
ncbi:MAG: hypothetical protein ACK5NY_08235 [Burkholderiaceae bacterium]|jgi:hypothetical protein